MSEPYERGGRIIIPDPHVSQFGTDAWVCKTCGSQWPRAELAGDGPCENCGGGLHLWLGNDYTIRMRLHHRYLAPTEPLRREVPSAIGYCETCAEYCDGDEPGGFSCTCCDDAASIPNRQEP